MVYNRQNKQHFLELIVGIFASMSQIHLLYVPSSADYVHKNLVAVFSHLRGL